MPKSGGGMNSVRGVYSYKSNPMKAPKQVSRSLGPNSNPDAQKIIKMQAKAYAERDSLRGKSGL